ncbi:MAG: class III extradiol ring-cleavage dioxygenase [Archangium sp.]|nr:class III extradiol ring-cleavage dioxygenase [Archangium sp.]MDP3154669.1 class III extradiol ring-cleavage dioxygenase [Archangium sp.]MDP3572703.1 class III extradiol ring-cleavage dioxygenase [Archangium sp.]
MSKVDLTRRQVLAAVAATGVSVTAEPKKRLPTLFVAHGAPPLLDMPSWVGELAAWGTKLGKPKAILMLSAHWEARPFTLGATTPVPLVYDFYGFPKHHSEQKYASPGAPALAARLHSLVKNAVDEPKRGLDHGAYVPLVAMYPKADVPVLQASLPSMEPKELLELGKALTPLRDEGVLIIGSGFITHNLRYIDWNNQHPTPQWAAEFDQWTAEALIKKDVDALMQYREKAPGVRIALPTHEHFVPLLVAMGAALDEEEPAFPIEGFWVGSMTRRSVQFG